MNKKRLSVVVAFIGASALVLALAQRVDAVPAFAREHGFSCSTCHDPFPRLKEYGEDFAGNAFAPSDKGGVPTRYFKDVGDDKLSLIRKFPLAVRGDFFMDFRPTGSDKGDGFLDFKTPYGLKMLSGGRIADDIGYYFYFYLLERGEVGGIEDAFIHFNNLFGQELDLIVGQFQVCDPLFKRELRLTFKDYEFYTVSPGKSRTNLKYDRGLMLMYSPGLGLDITAMVMNGNGKGGADPAKDLDFDRYKHYMLRVLESIGPFSFGGFGFYGREDGPDILSTDPVTGLKTTVGTTFNEINMWGIDASLSTGRFTLSAQYLERRDSNPSFLPVEQIHLLRKQGNEWVTTRGTIVEAVTRVMGDPGDMYLIFLFNWIDSNDSDLDQEAYTANITYLLRRNIKLNAEYTFNRIYHGNDVNESRVLLGLVTAF